MRLKITYKTTLFKALGGRITQTFEIDKIVFQNSSTNLILTNTISFVNMWNFINPNLKRDCPEEKCQRDSLYDQEEWIRTFLKLEGHGCNTRPDQKRRRVHEARP